MSSYWNDDITIVSGGYISGKEGSILDCSALDGSILDGSMYSALAFLVGLVL
jgi:hypothetical protein